MHGYSIANTSARRDLYHTPVKIPSGYKLAILHETPSEQDVREGVHLTGSMNTILWNVFKRMGIVREMCTMMACTHSPTTITKANAPTELASNHADIAEALKVAQPNLVLLVGPHAFAMAMGPVTTKNKTTLSNWRGSIFRCTLQSSPLYGQKCMGILAPYQIAKQWGEFPVFSMDIKRALEQSTFEEIRETLRTYTPMVTPDDAIARMYALALSTTPVAMDIEGGVNGVTCISFTNEDHYAFCIPLETYTPDEMLRVVPAIGHFLSSHAPKVLQNTLYDNFVLSWLFKQPIANVVGDTMLSGWEIYPELPKSLGVQVSLWTDHPFYKSERTDGDRLIYYTYCCKDSCLTLELHKSHMAYLATRPDALAHYQENVAMLVPLLYMQVRGIRYNAGLGQCELTTVQQTIAGLENRINEIARTVSSGTLTNVNVRSPDQIKNLLYTQMHYPVQHIKKTTDDGLTYSETTGVDALLELKSLYTGPQHEILDLILAHRNREGVRKQLTTSTDGDGRVRCAYNVVGTETGRLTCYSSPTGSGSNLQTITKKLRHLYCADPGYHMFQCDLAGADGWTVAAHCARLGDSTMFDDYLYGLKPAKIIALLYKYGSSVNQWDRAELKIRSKEITEEGDQGWLYFACKRVQHGSNYGLGKLRMSKQILKDSFKLLGRAIVVSPSDCLSLQKLYLDERYVGVRRWQHHVKEQLQTTGVLPCASGHTRRFFGRRDDHETYMQALAHEPQANTTCATNRAIQRLWNDPENRKDSRLIIEPLHQVHDAVIGQFPIDLTPWATEKIKSYFQNPLIIANTKITIPFDGGYGPSWGELTNPL